MASLKRILQDAVDRRLTTGGTVSAGLVKQLRAHRKQQLIVFGAIEVAIVAAVGLSTYFVAINPAESTKAQTIAAVLGIGAGTGGGIEIIRRVWRDWSQTALLLLLLEDASEAQASSTLDRLISKL